MEDESREREEGRGNEGQNQRSRRKKAVFAHSGSCNYDGKLTEASGRATCNELESFISKF